MRVRVLCFESDNKEYHSLEAAMSCDSIHNILYHRIIFYSCNLGNFWLDWKAKRPTADIVRRATLNNSLALVPHDILIDREEKVMVRAKVRCQGQS